MPHEIWLAIIQCRAGFDPLRLGYPLALGGLTGPQCKTSALTKVITRTFRIIFLFMIVVIIRIVISITFGTGERSWVCESQQPPTGWSFANLNVPHYSLGILEVLQRFATPKPPKRAVSAGETLLWSLGPIYGHTHTQILCYTNPPQISVVFHGFSYVSPFLSVGRRHCCSSRTADTWVTAKRLL